MRGLAVEKDEAAASSPHRRMVVGAALLAGVMAWLVVASGLIVPQLSWQADGAGGDYTQHAGGISVRQLVPVRNDGWVSATVADVALPALVGVEWGDVEGLPAMIAPGETHVVEVHAQVEDCGVVVDGYDVVPLRAKVAFLPSVTVELGSPFSGDPAIDGVNRPVGSPAAGMVRDQPPSWILDAVAWPCTGDTS